MRKQEDGFTLVELVMVVIIIATIAAIIIPKFIDQVTQAKISTTKANLGTMRSAVELYAADHSGTYPSTDLTELLSNYTGTTYVRRMPVDGISTVSAVVNTQANAGGWYYNATNHEALPNLQTTDANGTAYTEY